jgi:hypothetical protein
MPSQNPDDYSWVFTTRSLHVLENEAVELSRTLDADGAHAQASVVRSAFFDLLNELKRIAATVAATAEAEIVHQEQATRVRGSGGQGRPLDDNLGVSEPLTAVEGSVGVNYEPDLVDWWWTNEQGFAGHIGRRIFGVFEPSHTRPGFGSGDTSFVPTRSGGKGEIKHAIPPRWFVRDGGARAEQEWHTLIRAAKSRFVQTCVAAVDSAPPPRPPGRRP